MTLSMQWVRVCALFCLCAILPWLAGCELSGAVGEDRVFTVDLAVDPSAGSPVSARELGQLLGVVVPFVVDRPGSSARLWVVGDSISSTRLLASFSSTASVQSSLRARRLHRERELARGFGVFDAVAGEVFRSVPRRSPLFESAARIMTSPAAGQRVLVLASDGRDTSLADFECGALPSANAWVRLLQSHGLFTSGYTGRLVLAYADVTPVGDGRCAASLERYQHVVGMWRAAATSAGLSFVLAPHGITTEHLVNSVATRSLRVSGEERTGGFNHVSHLL